jgi:hypothetical protein
MFEILLGIASWIALAGFSWLLLLHFQDEYERRTRERGTQTSMAPVPQPPADCADPAELVGMTAGPAHGILSH